MRAAPLYSPLVPFLRRYGSVSQATAMQKRLFGRGALPSCLENNIFIGYGSGLKEPAANGNLTMKSLQIRPQVFGMPKAHWGRVRFPFLFVSEGNLKEKIS